MNARMSRVRMRDLALFVAVATAVAVIVFLGAREAGVGDAPVTAGSGSASTETEATPAAARGEALSLSLTAPTTCETERGQGYGRDVAVYDDEGNFLRAERRFVAWYGVQEFTVSWSVSGGTGPYTLTIDGETEDVNGAYAGASGRGRVLCADTTVETFIEPSGPVRGLRGDPKVDSGWKTVRAVVTDANGGTAEATAQVYVILSIPRGSGFLLNGGKTYRVYGWLLTIPEQVKAETGSVVSLTCVGTDDDCESYFDVLVQGPGYEAHFGIGLRTGRERTRTVWLEDDRPRGAADAHAHINALLDRLADSIGDAPKGTSN